MVMPKTVKDWNTIRPIRLSEIGLFVKVLWVCSECEFGHYRFQNDSLEFRCENVGCDVDDITGGPVQYERIWQRMKKKEG